MRFHPDRNQGAASKFREVRRAYDLLRNPVRRQLLKFAWRAHQRSSKIGAEIGMKPLPGADADETSSDHNFSRTNGLGTPIAWLKRLIQLDRLPFKAIVFSLLAYQANHYRLGSTGLPSDSEFWPLLGTILGQGLGCAIITELLVTVAALGNRFRLRRIATAMLTVAIVACPVFLFLTLAHEGTGLVMPGHIVLASKGLPVPKLQTAAVIATLFCLYLWMLFACLFNRHHPIWESVLIWLGMAGAIWSSIVLL